MKLTETQKCLLISGDIDALTMYLLMEKKKEYKKEHFKMHPDLFTNDECELNFRFKKEDLLVVCEALRIPESNSCRNGTKFSGIEGSLINYITLRDYL